MSVIEGGTVTPEQENARNLVRNIIVCNELRCGTSISTEPVITTAAAPTLPQSRRLVGTTGQIDVTDNGAGSTFVLSLNPQPVNEIDNVGAGAEIAKAKIGDTVGLRSIVATAPLEVAQNADDVTVSIDPDSAIGAIEDGVDAVGFPAIITAAPFSAIPRTFATTGTGITIVNGDGVAGNPTFSLDSDLQAVGALASNGLIARTGSGTVAARTLSTTESGLTVTNGDGVSGNPTIKRTRRGFAAYKNGNQTGIVTATNTVVTTWSTTVGYSVGGDFNTTSGVFTAPYTGTYAVGARAVWALSNLGTFRWMVIFRSNGGGQGKLASAIDLRATHATVNPENVVAGNIHLDAGDTLNMTVRHDVGSNSTINATDGFTGLGTYFSVEWVGSD